MGQLKKYIKSDNGQKKITLFWRYCPAIFYVLWGGVIIRLGMGVYQRWDVIDWENVNLEAVLIGTVFLVGFPLFIFYLINFFIKNDIGKELIAVSNTLGAYRIAWKQEQRSKIRNIFLFVLISLLVNFLGESARFWARVELAGAFEALGSVVYFAMISALLTNMIVVVKRRTSSMAVLKQGLNHGLSVQLALAMANCSFGTTLFELKEKTPNGHVPSEKLIDAEKIRLGRCDERKKYKRTIS